MTLPAEAQYLLDQKMQEEPENFTKIGFVKNRSTNECGILYCSNIRWYAGIWSIREGDCIFVNYRQEPTPILQALFDLNFVLIDPEGDSQ